MEVVEARERVDPFSGKLGGFLVVGEGGTELGFKNSGMSSVELSLATTLGIGFLFSRLRVEAPGLMMTLGSILLTGLSGSVVMIVLARFFALLGWFEVSSVLRRLS